MRRVLSALLVLAACASDEDEPLDSDSGDETTDETDEVTETDPSDETDVPLPPDPEPMDVTLAPEAPLPGEALTCTADPPNGAEVAWRWYRNDAPSDVLEATVPEGRTEAYERWRCVGLTLDGLYEGEATVTIGEACRSLHVTDASGLLRVETTGRSALSAVDQPFTFEAWIRHTGATERQDVVHLRDFLFENRISLILSIEDGQLVFRTDDADDDCAVLSAPAPEADEWHHVSASWDPTQGLKQLHVDGVSVATCESTDRPAQPINGFLTLGGAVYADPTTPVRHVFQGWIDEVRLSSTARYLGNFSPVPLWHEPDADTLLLLHMNELVDVTVSGETRQAVRDQSGNGWHAVVSEGFPGLSDEHSACELRP